MKQKKRYCVPTLADLIDRLSTLITKKVWSNDNINLYQKEIDLIKSDINSIMEEKDGMQLFNADMIEAAMIIMLNNSVIEQYIHKSTKKTFKPGESNKLLELIYSMDNIKNIAKNNINIEMDDFSDLKENNLSIDVPEEYGKWDYIFNDATCYPTYDDYNENDSEDKLDIDEIIEELEKKTLFGEIPETNEKVYYTNSSPYLKFKTDKNINYD